MERGRGSQDSASTAAAALFQGSSLDVTAHHRPQHYSHTPRSEYGPGGIFSMNPSSFPRGSSMAGFQASDLIGLDGLQRRTLGWGTCADGARRMADVWAVGSHLSLRQSSGGGGSSAVGGSGSGGVSDDCASAEDRSKTARAYRQEEARTKPSTASSSTETKTRRDLTTPVQDCGPLGANSDRNAASDRASRQVHASSQHRPDAFPQGNGRQGLGQHDIGRTRPQDDAKSLYAPSPSRHQDQKEQERQVCLQSPASYNTLTSPPPATPFRLTHPPAHTPTEPGLASPCSSTTQTSKRHGDCATGFPGPLSPLHIPSILAAPPVTDPSSSTITSWPLLSANQSSSPQPADALFYPDHHLHSHSARSLFSKKHPPLPREGDGKMPSSDQPQDTFKAQDAAEVQDNAIPHQPHQEHQEDDQHDGQPATTGAVEIYDASASDGRSGASTEDAHAAAGNQVSGDYYLDRGRGRCTRLIPADMLPSLVGIPAIEMVTENMTVLPFPGPGQDGPSTYHRPVELAEPPTAGPVADPGSSFPDTHGGSQDNVQTRIDSIVASQPMSCPRPKLKIYCDKWVHEGICAFTQQGCKYKHEMPFDKQTQLSLGLFHGFPPWWRRHQAELQRTLEYESQASMGLPADEQALVISSRTLNNMYGSLPPPPAPPPGLEHRAIEGAFYRMPTAPPAPDRRQQVLEMPWRRQLDAPVHGSMPPTPPSTTRDGRSQTVSDVPSEGSKTHHSRGYSHGGLGLSLSGFGGAVASYSVGGRVSGSQVRRDPWGPVGAPMPASNAGYPGMQALYQAPATRRICNLVGNSARLKKHQSSPESPDSTDSNHGGAKLTNPEDDLNA